MTALLDTCIVIDIERGHADAIRWLRELTTQPALSVVSIAELFAGVRSDSERKRLESSLGGFEVLPIEQRLAMRAGELVRQYRRSHGLHLLDAMIAATAEAHALDLVTLNTKHFPMLPGLTRPY